MRVMLVNDFYTPYMVGGTEALVCQLALGLRDRKHEVAVVTARIGQLPAKELIQGITVFRIGSFPGIKRAQRIASGTAPGRLMPVIKADFESVIASFLPDVIHFHNIWLLGPAVVHLTNCRKGITLHDYWSICVRRTMIRVNGRLCPGPSWLACRVCRLRAPATLRSLDLINIERERFNHVQALTACDFITAPSQFLARQIALSSRFLPQVIYNGLAVEAGAVRDSGTLPYVLFASRPTAEKGYNLIRRAFARPELQGYELYVAGEAAPNKMSNIKILGWQQPSSMLELIARAACVVVPSLWPENCPMIILESLRAGVPVVASRIGGIPELVEDGVTGLFVPAGDETALAGAISHCCQDEELRASAKRLGPATVEERFSLAGMISRLEKLYAS